MTTSLPSPRDLMFSPAAERNGGPIAEVLDRHLPARGLVLEIAAGSGQHAVAFAARFPGLEWTPSDPSPEARASLRARIEGGPPNLRSPLALDASDPTTWPEGDFAAVVCINMIHISPWRATEGLMRLAGERLTPGGVLYLYGPYREGGRPLAASNATFDDSLKARDQRWGLREVEAVVALAASHGLSLLERVAMPANNLSLVFRRSATD